MAAELVGGAFLSASLQVLFERLSSREVVDFISGKKPIDQQIKELKIKLLSANLVLNDAEEKQIRNPSVKVWLDELKDTIYEAEDLMADIKTQALESKLEGEYRSSSSQVLKFISTPFAALDKVLKSKLSGTLDRLDFIVKQKDVLGLKEGIQCRHSLRLSATLAEESGVYGRDVDKEAIVKLLCDDDITGSKISVISIVGMGGIGKTTLAQLVYDNARVEKHFDVKAWATVSDEFDVFRITRTTFEMITSRACEIKDLHQLQVKLKNALKGKKFLLVLDDVWNENYVHWDVLKSPLEYGAHGSKIIVTTRSEIVASRMSNVPSYYLETISDEACWLLFAKHAFSLDSRAHPMLEVIGRQIVRKCKGLPLAVKSLGGLLRSVLDPEEWKKILKSDIWELSEKESNILPALWLSYHYLPPHLKRCFAYCSIFPKGYKLIKEKIILLWMAEDLLQPQQSKRIEEVGNEYFYDLVSRSLFQQARHSELFFKMHDLVNDLAKFVSGKFCSRLDNKNSPTIFSKTRHLSFMKRNVKDIKHFEALFDAKCLRTFLPLGWRKETEQFPLNNLLLHELLRKVLCLRVLSLSEYIIVELPDSIGNLKQLRYLDLSWTQVKELPNTLCTLYNLETLILSHCRHLIQLPTNMGNLINLRYLYIECTSIKEMPQEMYKMKNLQALTDFVLGEHSGSSIRQLRKLQQLRGYLCISGLQNVTDVKDVVEANLKDKRYITKLHLKWDWCNHVDDSQNERMVLDRLQPHASLKEVFILCYRGTRFPDWVGDYMFSNISVVSLSNCKNCCLLPPLGQLPSLRKLDIRGFNGVVKIGAEFYSNGCFASRPFGSLEVLRFGDMPEWKEWSFIGSEDELFPRLKELYLRDCPKLIGGLPDYLPNLTTLYISRCQQLMTALQRDIQVHTAFPSLRVMEISNCLELESFLEGGLLLPSSLNELSIINCKKLFANRIHWNLQRLTSLTCLRIRSMYEGALDSFPEEGLLPATLISLSISNLPNLKELNGKGFQHLVCLKQMWILSCEQLHCLPKEGLPDSLSYLFIFECPLLNRRCQREKGEDWPKISYINRVQIDGEFI